MNTGVSIRFTSLQYRSFISPHRDLLSQIARYVADQSHDDVSVRLPDEWSLGHSEQLKMQILSVGQKTFITLSFFLT